MSIMRKLAAQIGDLVLFGNSQVSAQAKSGGYDGWVWKSKSGHAFKTGAGKRPVRDLLTQKGVAITVGVGATSYTSTFNLATIPANPGYLLAADLLDTYSLGKGVLDCPRTLAFRGSAGNGTYTGASARCVIITGTDKDGKTIKDTVALNTATTVYTKKAFKSITSVYPGTGFVTGTTTVSIGPGPSLGLSRPIQIATDILEWELRAYNATAYTVTAIPTTDIGEAYSTLYADIDNTQTSIVLVSGTGFPNAIAIGEIFSDNGTREEIIITATSTNTLTVVRSANGTTAPANGWPKGTKVAWRPGMTVTPASISANDRFVLTYLSDLP